MERPSPNGSKKIWTRGNLREALPEVVTPLSGTFTVSTLNSAAAGLFEPYFKYMSNDFDYISTSLWKSRLYFNLSDTVHLAYVANGAPPEYWSEAFGGLLKEKFDIPKLGIGRKLKILLESSGQLKTLRALPAQAEVVFKEVEERAYGAGSKYNYHEAKLSTLTLSELKVLFNDEVEMHRKMLLMHVSVNGPAFGLFAAAKNYADKWLSKIPNALSDMLLGLSDDSDSLTTRNISFSRDREIWKLAEEAKKDKSVSRIITESGGDDWTNYRELLKGTSFLTQFETFLSKHGHRSEYELDLFQERLWERPHPVLSIIKAILSSENVEDPNNHLVTQRQRREAITEKVRKELSGGLLSGYKKFAFFSSAELLQKLTVLRDNSRNFLALQRSQVGRVVREIGKRLKAEGILKSPSDIALLTYQELEMVLKDGKIEDLQEIIEASRRELESNRKLKLSELVFTSNLEPSTEELLAEDGEQGLLELTGLGVSAGRSGKPLIGKVNRITSTDQFHKMRKGEILVAPQTDPMWTPLFSMAEGVVTEVGGISAHAAIVAREYGIAAVVNVKNATSILADGDKIEVDGRSGHVKILEKLQPTGLT